MQARTANEVLKAQERRLRLQRLKGELVERARAVAQVFKLARDERDAWVNWPARVAAPLAAELGVARGEDPSGRAPSAEGTMPVRTGATPNEMANSEQLRQPAGPAPPPARREP